MEEEGGEEVHIYKREKEMDILKGKGLKVKSEKKRDGQRGKC